MKPTERFAHLIQSYFSIYLVKQRDVSLQTVKAYRDTFRLLLNYLWKATGKPPDQLTLDDLSAANALAFLQHIEKFRGNCVRTRNSRLAALRSFVRFAIASEGPDLLAQSQQIMSIPIKRFTRPLMSFLSVDEMVAVLESAGDSWTGRRDHLLLLFLYNTGARVSEAISVRVSDVQRHDFKAVELLGKGRKERMVPLWKETSRAIRNWVKSGGLTSDQLLFPNRFGTAMTRTAVQQRLHLHVQSAAEERCPSLRKRHISPHTIRHTTAMHLLQSGVTTPVIALWLGHADPATTHQYIEADLQMKEAALTRLQPPREKQGRFKPPTGLLRFLDRL
jgi:site-specific recombinase XerD